MRRRIVSSSAFRGMASNGLEREVPFHDDADKDRKTRSVTSSDHQEEAEICADADSSWSTFVHGKVQLDGLVFLLFCASFVGWNLLQKSTAYLERSRSSSQAIQAMVTGCCCAYSDTVSFFSSLFLLLSSRQNATLCLSSSSPASCYLLLSPFKKVNCSILWRHQHVDAFLLPLLVLLLLLLSQCAFRKYNLWTRFRP